MSLPALARVDRILLSILLLGALLAALLHWLLAAPEKTGGLERLPSTFYNVGTGTKAAYEVLDQLKYPVARLRRRISPQSLQGVGVLFILRPTAGLARQEVAALKDWIEEGHALVVVPGAASTLFAPVDESPRGGDFFDDWFDYVDVPAKSVKKADGLPPAERPAPLRRIAADDAFTAGITELAVPELSPDGRRFDPKTPCRGPLQDAAARVFWKDPQGTIGLAAELGDGMVVALADEYPLTNLGLGEGDNGLLLANLAREMSTRYPGQVAFDEFHLGFAASDVSPVAIVRLMLDGPWRWAALQAALVGVLALFARAVRFGSPQDVLRKPRRQHREFAEAAGRLFDEAGATSLAAETLYRYYRERICRALLIDPQIEDRHLCEAVQRRAGAAVAAELQQAQAALQGSVSRQELLPWVAPSLVEANRRGSLSRKDLLAVSQKLHRCAGAVCPGHHSDLAAGKYPPGAMEALDHGT